MQRGLVGSEMCIRDRSTWGLKYSWIKDIDNAQCIHGVGENPARCLHLSVANEAAPTTTEDMLSIQEIQRKLIGEGFHRRLETNLTISGLPSFDPKMCNIYAIEFISEYLFVENDFLNELPGVDFWTNEETDIELPSSKASQYLLRFKFQLNKNNMHYSSQYDSSKGVLKIQYYFPIHFRYQSVGFTEFSEVPLFHPHLFVDCGIETNVMDNTLIQQIKKTQNALPTNVIEILYHSSLTNFVLKDKMPIGQHKDKPLVLYLSLIHI
eukprot:TRINITY_DN22798_c0_g1_i3.p1 TRINITY_DN22798_c0_g1~~TRINITY_DN22798_c0_g1_i3.p1  ORF type:complete len:266 (-),score=40.35 TRINITY_DN22798_c0_g1_i3:130-927(-)